MDLETTGKYINTDYIISVGIVEIIDNKITRNSFYREVNPEKCKYISDESVKIHGLKLASLRKQPTFKEIIPEFLKFIGDSDLIIHNMIFDTQFIEKELQEAGYNPKEVFTNKIICTVEMSRNSLPIVSVTLDKLVSYFKIFDAHRDTHGALKDAMLLAKVYLYLIKFNKNRPKKIDFSKSKNIEENKEIKRLIVPLSLKEYRLHQLFLFDNFKIANIQKVFYSDLITDNS